jgi:ferredoxin
MVLYVDGDRCIGCELCTDSLPDVFRMNSHGVSEVHNSSGASASEIWEAIESCPAECIVNQ